VDADQAAVLRCLVHGAEDRCVVYHQHAGIGHKQLETGNAPSDQPAHFLERRVAEIGDDAMKRIVDRSLAVGLLHPGLKSLPQALALLLDAEIDQRGAAAEGHVEVRVDDDSRGITNSPAASITLPTFSTGSASAMAAIRPPVIPM
jgi:hypothetical protein